MTGLFPRNEGQALTTGPLNLVWCPDSGLLQLSSEYEQAEMYGINYGYRSSLNSSMVAHLTRKALMLERYASVKSGDVVIDIGSNDATFLSCFQQKCVRAIGIDPVAQKFTTEYDRLGIKLITDFFSSELAAQLALEKSVKLITSIAMFYDLPNPHDFVSGIKLILANDGIWHFEQSYMPSMLRMNSYDTICHEHLEYYSFGVVYRLLEAHGLKVLDVQMNAINGGSFAVTAAHQHSEYIPNFPIIKWLLRQEDAMSLDTPRPYREFEDRIYRHRSDLKSLIHELKASNKRVLGYGASTKGNVILQFCNLDSNMIDCIAEVNPEKYGCYTPGTNIPIVSEADAKAMNPDYMLVLPWHFRDSIIRREEEYLANGGKLIFPLPEIEIV